MSTENNSSLPKLNPITTKDKVALVIVGQEKGTLKCWAGAFVGGLLSEIDKARSLIERRTTGKV